MENFMYNNYQELNPIIQNASTFLEEKIKKYISQVFFFNALLSKSC